MQIVQPEEAEEKETARMEQHFLDALSQVEKGHLATGSSNTAVLNGLCRALSTKTGEIAALTRGKNLYASSNWISDMANRSMAVCKKVVKEIEEKENSG